ncbi:phosphopyruvate hydratase [Methanoculleus sp. FWC-SCC1]|uniref:Enolase n=1 Tax=Methanoculleus frigidifontis TaxID=2584085 RepID=A0ABT8M755_9EURY|nr:phosphopyruvate hydratase [Methanoculleus sp. FWC-SCC1]MDN7023755.1 phosphopyruvate hydratase [Methanoculleus sp. FWC-SCC1]
MTQIDTTIRSIHAREILDSRGNPTVEAEVTLACGAMGRAASPSGASTGVHEALELRDGVIGRYNGKGVQRPVSLINGEIRDALTGLDAGGQQAVDEALIRLDGTANKENLGANSTLAVSMAVARAAAAAAGRRLWEYLGDPTEPLLPVPAMNILNGGVHANWQGPDFQEYMIAPYGAPTFAEALRWGAEIYHALKTLLKEKGYSTGVGDEGGFAPAVSSNTEPLDLIVAAIERAGYRPGQEIGIALDPASSSFYTDGAYELRTEGLTLDAAGMVDRYRELADTYPIVSIEDGLAEDDWDGWKLLNDAIGDRVELVGDDLFVTNVNRIERGIREGTANAVLIKPNQIGTVTETIAAVRLAHKNSWGAMVSHRSGETVDTFIADFTVAMRTGHLKAGAPARGERVEKYNQLLRIEEEAGNAARYAGRKGFIR